MRATSLLLVCLSLGACITQKRHDQQERGRAKNRRIEIAVVPDLSRLPRFDELTRIAGAP